jgi:flagellar motility protein MotE (MotC chaperone)
MKQATQTRPGESGASPLGSILALVFGGGAALVVLSLFLTGLAQNEIIPRVRDRAARAVAAHTPRKEPAAAVSATPIDTLRTAPRDSLEALATQMETERQFLDGRKDELTRLRGGIDSLLTKHQEAQSKELIRQAKLLASMRPEEAAQVLAAMDDATVSALLETMNARAASKVLAKLDAQRVARLSMAAIGVGETESFLSSQQQAPAVNDGSAGQ